LLARKIQPGESSLVDAGLREHLAELERELAVPTALLLSTAQELHRDRRRLISSSLADLEKREPQSREEIVRIQLKGAIERFPRRRDFPARQLGQTAVDPEDRSIGTWKQVEKAVPLAEVEPRIGRPASFAQVQRIDLERSVELFIGHREKPCVAKRVRARGWDVGGREEFASFGRD